MSLFGSGFTTAVLSVLENIPAVIYYGHQIGNVDMQCSLQEFGCTFTADKKSYDVKPCVEFLSGPASLSKVCTRN